MVGKLSVALRNAPPISPFAEPAAAGAAGGPRRGDKLLPVEALLRQHKTLTAVERFARKHDAGELPEGTRSYRALMPARAPGVGEQYAFDVDLDRCTGCKACVAGCHSRNGLDDDEMWRSVGLLHGGAPEDGLQLTVTSSCHHCVEPACLQGCPVNAYEKDPRTGIVKHLDDQCFGCQYCTLMCPYDAPKFNPRRKIVRKCDMCVDRLAHHEAPACVQACPNGAIAIRLVQHSEVIESSEAGGFLPGAPAPERTLPTTTYRSSRALPKNLLAADFYAISPEQAHSPLAFMLVATQWAVGLSCWSSWIGLWSADAVTAEWVYAANAFVICVIGLTIGLLHLGRPWLAWRAVLNLRQSWFSREALAFGGYAALALLVLGLELLLDSARWAPSLSVVLPRVDAGLELLLGSARWAPGLAARIPGFHGSLEDAVVTVRALAAAAGCVAVYCSVMVYVATQREQWRAANTALRFFGTSIVLGASQWLLLWSLTAAAPAGLPAMVRGLLWTQVGVTLSKLLYEASVFRHVNDKQQTLHKRLAEVMRRELAGASWLRMIASAVGGLLVPLGWLLWQPRERWQTALLAVLGTLLLLLGELSERTLFFRAAPASKMPGALR